MNQSILFAVPAALGGAVIALINARLTRRTAEKKPESIGSIFLVRQLLNVGYLALVYYLSHRWADSMTPLLIGAVLGLTVPSFLFALRLSRENSSGGKKSGKTKGDE